LSFHQPLTRRFLINPASSAKKIRVASSKIQLALLKMANVTRTAPRRCLITLGSINTVGDLRRHFLALCTARVVITTVKTTFRQPKIRLDIRKLLALIFSNSNVLDK